MLRVLTIALAILFSASTWNCAGPCRKTQKTNQKLMAGKHDFGKKTGKWKRKQKY